MKKILYYVTIVLILLLSFNLNTFSTNALDEDYSGYRDEIGNWIFEGYTSIYDEAYYKDINENSDRQTLINGLNALITSTRRVDFTYHSYSSGNYMYTGTVIADADQDPNNHDNVICLYTGHSYAKTSANSNWNVEHVWPQSHNVTGERKSDVHHLKPTNVAANSARASYDFGELESGSSYGTNTEYDDRSFLSGTVFCPRDSVKGDVARMLFYMDIMYPELELISSLSTSGNNLGNLEDLKRWHEIDPVDDFERRRNDVVEYYQGNRNPFIDHPEYADIIFGTNYSTSSSTKKFKVNYILPSASSFDFTDNSFYESGDKVLNPLMNPVLAGFEFKGWLSIDKEDVDNLNELITYKDLNGKLWNFDEDVISDNLYLFPYYEWDGSLDSVYENASIKYKVIFDYKKSVIESYGETVTETIAITPVSGPGALNPYANQEIDVTEYFGLNDLFQVVFHTNGKNAAYVRNGEFRLYNYNENGTEIVFTTLDETLVIDSVSLDTENISVNISSDKKSFSLKNITSSKTSGNIPINSFEITYTKGKGDSATYKLSNLYLSFKEELDFFNAPFAYDDSFSINDYEFGYLINCEKIVSLPSNNDGKWTVLLSYIPNDTKELHIKPYVEYNRETYFGKERVLIFSDLASVITDTAANLAFLSMLEENE